MINLLYIATLLNLVIVVQCHEMLLDFLEFPQSHPEVKLSESCANSLSEIKNGIESDELWAMKVRDASGSSSSGFIWGNNFWLGQKDPCNSINDPNEDYLISSRLKRLQMRDAKLLPPIPVEYRMFYVSHSSPTQFHSGLVGFIGIHIGLCFPKLCDENEVNMMAETVSQSEEFQNSAIYGNVSFAWTKTLKLRENFYEEPFTVLLMLIITIFAVLSAVGSTIFYHQAKTGHESKSKNIPDDEISSKSTRKDARSADEIHGNKDLNNSRSLSHNSSLKFFEGFAIQANFNSIVATSSEKESISCVNFLRAAGAISIIVIHIYGIAENYQIRQSFNTASIFQPSLAWSLYVENFFVLSGFLLAYNFCEQQKKKLARMSIFRKIIARYFRINASFLLVMIMSTVIAFYLNDTSQFVMFDGIETNCKKFWWRNLLLIQNLFKVDESCIVWSWYAAADFHLYIITIALLAISVKHKKLSIFLTIVIVASSLIYLSYHSFQKAVNINDGTLNQKYETLYFSSWVHVSPYAIGTLSGCYLSNIDRRWNVSKKMLNLGWIMSIGTIGFLALFKETSLMVAAFFSTFARTMLGAALGFIILATASKDDAESSQRFWYSKIITILNRLSYSSYMLNYIIILAFYLSKDYPFHFTSLFLMGFICTVNLAAFVFALFFEYPLSHLASYITRSSGRLKRKNSEPKTDNLNSIS